MAFMRLALFLVPVVVCAAEQWSSVADLDDRVRLSWQPSAQGVRFLLEAATRGYVGVGFSPSGAMARADIVLAWVDDANGIPHLMDCHGTDKNAAPVFDSSQDYRLEGGHQNETHTVVKFSRPWDTCDARHDLVLGNDTVRVIWALHEADPNDGGGPLAWHGKLSRGVHSVHLARSQLGHNKSHTQHWDVNHHNLSVPDNMDTLYWCKIFKVPPLGKKHHMIGYEPLTSAGSQGLVHHMVLYECLGSPHFEQYVTQPGTVCYSSDMPHHWNSCQTTVVAWAIGSQGEFFPEHVGLPLAEGDDKATYFMLETHYDNPTLRKVSDNSGLRLFYTEKLRKYDGAVLVSGISVSPLHIIPPQQKEYTTTGYCDNQCTNLMFPDTGINVISVVLHSHIAGRQLRLRHVREGHELPVIAQDNHYDFNYQQSRVLGKEVVVMPGDELITECVYETINRTEPTLGGFSTKQEMCLAFALYYPRTALSGCFSITPIPDFFQTFGVTEFYSHDMATVEKAILKLSDNQLQTSTEQSSSAAPSFPSDDPFDRAANDAAIQTLKKMADFTTEGRDVEGGGLFSELIIRESAEFRNKTFMAHLRDLPWGERLLTQTVESSLRTGRHLTFCRLQDDSLAMPSQSYKYPNFTALPNQADGMQRCQNLKRHVELEASHSVRTFNTHLASTAVLISLLMMPAILIL